MDNHLKLLLLEDNADDAELIKELLKRSGMRFSADVVSDEMEFLHALDCTSYDAVLADNALPQYSSIEALSLIKQKNPFTAFILVTGTVSEEFAVKIIQQGADDYLLKTNLTRLSSAISNAISGRKMQQEKMHAEKEMTELNTQLRDLSSHLQEVREEEQARIAREIHDELGQMLTALKMDISSAGRKVDNAPADAKKHMTDAMSLVDNMIKTVRKIASELRPTILDDLGLEAALDWQMQEFGKHNPDIKTVFYSSLYGRRIEKNIATAVYRIFQESLTNIARHAAATRIRADVNYVGGSLVLQIADNGKGIDTAIVKEKRTFGLVGMKERALLLQGSLVIDGAAGRGTMVTLTIPLK